MSRPSFRSSARNRVPRDHLVQAEYLFRFVLPPYVPLYTQEQFDRLRANSDNAAADRTTRINNVFERTALVLVSKPYVEPSFRMQTTAMDDYVDNSIVTTATKELAERLVDKCILLDTDVARVRVKGIGYGSNCSLIEKFGTFKATVVVDDKIEVPLTIHVVEPKDPRAEQGYKLPSASRRPWFSNVYE